MYKTIAILFCCMLSSVALAQSHSVQGTLLDESSTESIDQAVVSIGSSTTTQSDANGRFLLENISPGIYNIKIQHPKYTDFVLVFEIKQEDIDLGVLLMESNSFSSQSEDNSPSASLAHVRNTSIALRSAPASEAE